MLEQASNILIGSENRVEIDISAGFAIITHVYD